MNNVILIGRLTKDPELRYIPVTGTAVCKFTLAVDRGLSTEKKAEMKSKNQATADFIQVTVWGKVAENSANHLAKGLKVAIQGRIQTGFYEKDGNRVYTTEVVANSVEFLEWKDKNSQGISDYGDMSGFHPIDNDDIPF